MPGKVLICRHMRIVSNMSHTHASKDNRNMYLTSTGSTHVSSNYYDSTATYKPSVDKRCMKIRCGIIVRCQ